MSMLRLSCVSGASSPLAIEPDSPPTAVKRIYPGYDITFRLSQIAARLDSLRRASLDLSGAPGFPAEARHGDGERHEQSSSGDAVDSRPGWRDDKALSAAAREFLSRRCSASLATAGPSARHQERLSQALVREE